MRRRSVAFLLLDFSEGVEKHLPVDQVLDTQ